jgi:hypothetical protein
VSKRIPIARMDLLIIFLKEASTRASCLALGSFLLVALFASASEAQQRTFVSGLGNDANPCSRIAPCRTFTQALSVTNAGGEVVVLDSAGYGGFVITQAVTVQAPLGVYAGISVFSGDGIVINAGGADTVILRGLTVNNQGSSGNGILFRAGAELHVESCDVNGFTSGEGLFFNGPGQLEVKDSILRGNLNAIDVAPASGTAFASIDNVRLEGTGVGLLVLDRSMVTIRNSLFSGHLNGGVHVNSGSADAAELDIENCMFTKNGYGIAVESMSTGVATVRISNSIITHNGIGLFNVFGSPAVLLSRGNNTLEGNGTDTSGTIGSYTAK